MEPTMPERDPVDDEDAWMFPPLRQPSTGELRKLRDDLIKAMEGRHEVRILPSRPDGGTVHTNPVTETAPFYMIACRECGDPERPLPMPFGSQAERGKWAAAHTRGTGHDRWLVWTEVHGDA